MSVREVTLLSHMETLSAIAEDTANVHAVDPLGKSLSPSDAEESSDFKKHGLLFWHQKQTVAWNFCGDVCYFYLKLWAQLPSGPTFSHPCGFRHRPQCADLHISISSPAFCLDFSNFLLEISASVSHRQPNSM